MIDHGMDILQDVRTVSCGLDTVFIEEDYRAKLKDAVLRAHRITLDATELVSLHITRCFEEGVPLPFIDSNYFKKAMMEVSESCLGKRKKVDLELEKTRKEHMPLLQKVDRRRLDQVLMAQSICLGASFVTNLSMHFRKRVGRYIRLVRFQKLEDKKLLNKLHKLDTLKITSDVCKPPHQPFESNEEHHGLIRSIRDTLGTNQLSSFHMETNALKHQSVLLRAMYVMNKDLEAKDQKCFSLCPVRRSLAPRFIPIDTKAMRMIFEFTGSDHEKSLSKRRRNEAKRRSQSKEYRKKIGFPVIERTCLHKSCMLWGNVQSAIRIQRWWRRKNDRSYVCRLARENNWAIQAIQDSVRKYVTRCRRFRKEEKAAQKASLGAMKVDSWNDVIHIPRQIVKRMKGRTFSGSIRTDGISVRLCFTKPEKATKKRKRSEQTLESVPRRGIYAIDQLKHLSRQSYQLIGADPGKRELLVCVDEDAPHAINAKGTKKPTVRYTASQRRFEMSINQHASEEKRMLPDHIKTSIERMTDTNSRSSTLQVLSGYFQKRREWLYDALEHYEEEWMRMRRWKRFRLSQKSLTDFAGRIRSLQREKDVPIVIAYGSWASIAGRPGAVCNKGAPPCMGIGLRSKLSKHFCILVTPEQYTSKICSLCCSVCGPCQEVDSWHREKKIEEALKNDGCTKSAMKFSVRGLRRCQNNACAAYLNRDYNASVNIQRRCSSLLKGDGEALRQLNMLEDEVDKQLTFFEQEMRSGD